MQNLRNKTDEHGGKRDNKETRNRLLIIENKTDGYQRVGGQEDGEIVDGD